MPRAKAARPQNSGSFPEYCSLSWLGATLHLGLPHETWTDRLSDLSGLPVEPVTISEAEMIVFPDGSIKSFKDKVSFSTVNDALIWFVLTCADVLAEKRGAFLLHAASFLTERGLVLVFGPPFSGKSTLALMALSRGVPILGDDVVFLSTDDGLVRPVPRPPKRRLDNGLRSAEEGNALEIGTELHGYLDGKACALLPRSTMNVITNDVGLQANEIILLQRHEGPGIRLAQPERFEAVAAVLDWARDWSTPTLAAAGWVTHHLLKLKYTTVSVGDDEQEAALQVILHGSE